MDQLDESIRDAMRHASSERFSRERAGNVPNPTPRKPSRLPALVIGLLVGLAPIVWYLTAAGHADDAPRDTGSSLPHLIRTVQLGSGGRAIAGSGTSAVASAYAGVYVVGEGGEVEELDVPSYGAITAITASDAAFWMAGSADASTSKLIGMHAMTFDQFAAATFANGTINSLAATDDFVWVGLQTREECLVALLDATTGHEIRRYRVGSSANGTFCSVAQLVADGPNAWALVSDIRDDGQAGSPAIVAQSVVAVQQGAGPMTFDIGSAVGIAASSSGDLWIARGHAGLSLLHPDGETTNIPVDDVFDPVSAASDTVWYVELSGASEVSFVNYDPGSGSVIASIPLSVDEDQGKWPMAVSIDSSARRAWILNENGSVFVLSLGE